jgi:hypothetical protein
MASVVISVEKAVYPRSSHWFYTGMSIAFACIVFVGFSPSYFLKGVFGAPPLSLLLHVHGAAFTAWTIFYIFQNVLVLTGRTGLHRRIGMIGAFIACALVVLVFEVAVTSVRAGYLAGRAVGPTGEPPDILLMNALVTLALFCTFFGAAVYRRRQKEAHKRLMLLSMTALIFPAIGRIHFSLVLAGAIALLSIFAGLLHDAIFLRRISFTYLWGGLLIFMTLPVRLIVAGTPAWHRFLVWMVS